jgi:23S rRNA (cytosine1962-C5)-methyltransferase
VIEAALRAAGDRRAALGFPSHETDAFRWFDGRHEGVPGFVVDWYGAACRIAVFGREVEAERVRTFCDAVREVVGPSVGLVLAERGTQRLLDGEWPAGDPGDPIARPGRFTVREGGLRFGVDLAHGSNPGLFLDARPLRAVLRARSSNQRVLNLFSYTASFGVAALAGGAQSVTNVDAVPSAVARGEANHTLNGLLGPAAHVTKDAFAFLHDAARQDRTWDIVVLDPPPVATQGSTGRGRGRERGFDPRRDWPRLVNLAEAVTAPGGSLFAVTAHREAVAEAALGVSGAERFEAGEDFPGRSPDRLRAYWVPAGSRV